MTPGRALGLAGLGGLSVLVTQARRAATRGYLHNEPDLPLRARARPDGTVEALGHASAARPPVDGHLRMVAVGDSTARGVGAVDLGEAAPVAVATLVAAELDVPVEVVGLGFSGARTADVLVHQVPRVAELAPDVVVVLAGANDVTHGTPPWRFARATERVLAQLARHVWPRPGDDDHAGPASAGIDRVVLAGVGRFCDVPALERPLQDLVDANGRLFARLQRRACERLGAGWVDIARDASPRFFGRRETLSVDGFHPSGLGYRFWAEAIAPQVVAALTAGRSPAPDGP